MYIGEKGTYSVNYEVVIILEGRIVTVPEEHLTECFKIYKNTQTGLCKEYLPKNGLGFCAKDIGVCYCKGDKNNCNEDAVWK